MYADVVEPLSSPAATSRTYSLRRSITATLTAVLEGFAP